MTRKPTKMHHIQELALTRRPTIPPKVGDDALVPATAGTVMPALITTNPVPCADTSGKPLPVALYSDASGRFGAEDRYAATASSCQEGLAQRLEKPPELRPAAVSGFLPVVAPTAVTYGLSEGY